jgi:mRNA interferase MazF
MRRGDIYYIHKGSVVGSEQEGGRPAVIVSNDDNNKHSGVVEVVFLTTRPKTELPTHVNVSTSKYQSIALCEQINSVSKARIGEYVGRLTTEEMNEINEALLVSIGIEL